MAEHVDVERPCPRCGASARVHIGARCTDGRLRHSESIHCPHCRYTLEADGGALTTDVRDALCAVHGRWSARIRDLGPERARALGALRTYLGVSPAEALRVAREAAPIVVGARVEIEPLQALLEPTGAQLDIVRLP